MNTSLSTHNQTIPTTIGALLTEECTIDPLSHLPSFLELTFVDVARNSGRRALSAAWGVCVAWLEGLLGRLRQMERLADTMASRMNHSDASPSSLARIVRVIRGFAAQLARVRVRILRRFCHIFLGTIKTLGPELQTLIMYAIDYNCMHYLAGATACEMVYGLKRSKIFKAATLRHLPKNPSLNTSNKTQSDPGLKQVEDVTRQENMVTELTKFDKTSSALLAALLPYCKERCDQLYNQLKEQPAEGSSSYSPYNGRNRQNTRIDTKQKFVQLYPYFHMVHEGSIFLYQFAYLMGFSPYWSFSMHSLGVMLRRMTVADVQQQKQQHQQQQQQIKPISDSGPLQKSTLGNAIPSTGNAPKLTIPQMLRGAVLFSISYTLLSGWYSHFQRQLRLRRRRWIAGDEDESVSQSQEGGLGESHSRQRTQLPIPPPPMPPNLLENNDQNIDKWSCPICKDPRINPTASTSGYVFCYKCLVSHLRQKGEYCPMTGMPCRENKVVRLFEPTASRRRVAGNVGRA